MHVCVLTDDTAASPCLISPDLIPDNCKNLIEDCSDLVIKSATNHSHKVDKMIRLQVRIGDLCVPYRFGIVPNLPPGILIGTAFTNDHIGLIKPSQRVIQPNQSRPVPILASGTNQVSAIQTPQDLDPNDKNEISAPLVLAKRAIVPAGSQVLALVRTRVNGLVSLTGNTRLYKKHHCHVANGIAEVKAGQPFQIWITASSLPPLWSFTTES